MFKLFGFTFIKREKRAIRSFKKIEIVIPSLLSKYQLGSALLIYSGCSVLLHRISSSCQQLNTRGSKKCIALRNTEIFFCFVVEFSTNYFLSSFKNRNSRHFLSASSSFSNPAVDINVEMERVRA